MGVIEYVLKVECKHAFRLVINQNVLFIILPMSPYYQNTRTRTKSQASVHITDYCDIFLVFT